MRVFRDRDTGQSHDQIIHSRQVLRRQPLLDRAAYCKSWLHLFGYLTQVEAERIEKRIQFQRGKK